MNRPNATTRDSVPESGKLAALDETLRLISSIPTPEGLEDRIQDRIQTAVRAERQSGTAAASPKGRLLHWPKPLSLQSAPLRVAAAAAIVGVVVGGGWTICSRPQPAQPAQAVTQPARPATQSGFSNAGAMRTPQTINGPVVTQPEAAQQQNGEAQPKTAAPNADETKPPIAHKRVQHTSSAAGKHKPKPASAPTTPLE
jgi:hypothetical protein